MFFSLDIYLFFKSDRFGKKAPLTWNQTARNYIAEIASTWWMEGEKTLFADFVANCVKSIAEEFGIVGVSYKITRHVSKKHSQISCSGSFFNFRFHSVLSNLYHL